MRVYLASVRSVLVYGCESWTVTSSLSSTLDSCEFGFLRRLLGVKSLPFPRNSEVSRKCGIQSSLSQFVKRSRLIWLGHVLRMQENRVAQQVLLAQQSIQRKRARGRLCQTWDRLVHADTRSLTNNIRNAVGSITNWSVDGRRWLSYLRDLACNRTHWRQIVETLST